MKRDKDSMSDTHAMRERLETAGELAPAGYAVAFHIRYSAPTFLLQTYPKNWIAYYSLHALVMADPTVAWGFANEGTCRWSDLTDDPSRVMERAAEHGLKYGVVCAIDSEDSRSFGSFARSDREFTDAEIAALADGVAYMHSATRKMDTLPAESLEMLGNMSVNYSKG